MKMIETERTSLRPIELRDNKEILSYRSDSKTNKYQSWIPKTLNDVNAFISKNPDEFNKPETWFQLVIIDKANDTIIGDIGIHFIDNYQSEIGCTLRKKYHGKGFATEALKAVIDYLFVVLDKHRIVVSIDPENTESIRLVERLGFRKEAHFKKSLLINGEWVDDIVYAILKTEWK
jgi:RimJ/RimL family protein N-acetyltransferase